MRRRVLAPLLAVLLCFAAAGAPASADRRRDEATELVAGSVEHYRAGRYAEAAELLRRAYALTPSPVLLFNLGRALDKGGDRQGAIEAYRLYLDAMPRARDRAIVEDRIAELERSIPGEPEAPPAADE